MSQEFEETEVAVQIGPPLFFWREDWIGWAGEVHMERGNPQIEKRSANKLGSSVNRRS